VSNHLKKSKELCSLKYFGRSSLFEVALKLYRIGVIFPHVEDKMYHTYIQNEVAKVIKREEEGAFIKH